MLAQICQESAADLLDAHLVLPTLGRVLVQVAQHLLIEFDRTLAVTLSAADACGGHERVPDLKIEVRTVGDREIRILGFVPAPLAGDGAVLSDERTMPRTPQRPATPPRPGTRAPLLDQSSDEIEPTGPTEQADPPSPVHIEEATLPFPKVQPVAEPSLPSEALDAYELGDDPDRTPSIVAAVVLVTLMVVGVLLALLLALAIVLL